MPATLKPVRVLTEVPQPPPVPVGYGDARFVATEAGGKSYPESEAFEPDDLTGAVEWWVEHGTERCELRMYAERQTADEAAPFEVVTRWHPGRKCWLPWKSLTPGTGVPTGHVTGEPVA